MHIDAHGAARCKQHIAVLVVADRRDQIALHTEPSQVLGNVARDSAGRRINPARIGIALAQGFE